jgi:glutathione S-transferase
MRSARCTKAAAPSSRSPADARFDPRLRVSQACRHPDLVRGNRGYENIPRNASTTSEGIPVTDIYTMYGAQISNYSAKVRSYLIYKNIPFQEVVASNYVYDNLLVPTVGFRMMPMLRTPEGALLQDSTDIIDAMEKRFPDMPVYPSTPRQHLAALMLEAYIHDWVRVPAMYYRWAFPKYNRDYLVREFGRMYEPTLNLDDQIVLGDKNSAWTRDRLPALGVTAKTIPQFEAWTERLLGWLDEHFSRHDYLLGNRPCTADFTLMGPFYGHFYRDPYSFQLLRRIAPNVIQWIERMNTAPQSYGAFLPNDEVPTTLLPLLKHAVEEYFPVAIDTIRKLGKWIEENPGIPIPRFLGTQDFSIGGVSETRTVWTCMQYMMQRPLGLYQSATAKHRSDMDALVDAVGGDCRRDLSFKVARPVKRENYEYLAAS